MRNRSKRPVLGWGIPPTLLAAAGGAVAENMMMHLKHFHGLTDGRRLTGPDKVGG